MANLYKDKYALIISMVLLLAAFLGYALTPRNAMADSRPKIDLEKAIPKEFAGWHLDTRVSPISTTPELNEKGEQIMLSIAYGRDQGGDGSQVHRPEYCYPAQGFELKNSSDAKLKYKNDYIPIRRLLAVHGERSEPISYWVTVGETALRSGVDRKLAQISYGLKGTIPDGLLFRVSNISTDVTSSYQLQEKFTNDLLNSVDQQTRIRLAGNLHGE
jgi:EpsI family protein